MRPMPSEQAPRPAPRRGFLDRLFGRDAAPEAGALYNAVVERGREPHWYLAGDVPDTIDGRFDAIASVLAVVLLRLEIDPAGARPNAMLAERFIEDMDGQLREFGVGDVVVGKKVGKLMGALGGRLGAYRTALDANDAAAFEEALVRNLYRGERPAAAALAHSAGALRRLHERLMETPLDALLAGRLPADRLSA